LIVACQSRVLRFGRRVCRSRPPIGAFWPAASVRISAARLCQWSGWCTEGWHFTHHRRLQCTSYILYHQPQGEATTLRDPERHQWRPERPLLLPRLGTGYRSPSFSRGHRDNSPGADFQPGQPRWRSSSEGVIVYTRFAARSQIANYHALRPESSVRNRTEATSGYGRFC
jgi:hypothetical protein